ncbi:aspartyl-phosphate phosphatase Spo0E family protein [Bacillaceae bacterium Marseille-Q3522]|nr:aspartyl-phosphate phosphatase Spo0E family protein [Bacillaceae bacterium Marseille-Q3522]
MTYLQHHSISRKNLLEKIQLMRDKLTVSVATEGLRGEQTLSISQKLDEYIVLYQNHYDHSKKVNANKLSY